MTLLYLFFGWLIGLITAPFIWIGVMNINKSNLVQRWKAKSLAMFRLACSREYVVITPNGMDSSWIDKRRLNEYTSKVGMICDDIDRRSSEKKEARGEK